MSAAPGVRRTGDLDWETWADGETSGKGRVFWKTLVSADVMQSSEVTAGIARIPPGGSLAAHHHRQAEVYFFVHGSGVVRLGEREERVEPGSVVFVPGGTVHAVRNTAEKTELRFTYVFAADSFAEVEYVFERDGL